MNYSLDRYGRRISRLGLGCMRLPMSMGRINMPEAEKVVMTAIRAGVNYFDTAYIYPGSEAALGEILEKNHARDQVNITTKLPHYLIRSREGLDKLFDEELRRLRTDHLDYYLMHMLTDVGTWERLKALGVEDWLAKKKASGAIRQVGFSYHGNTETFCRLVDAYDWDMCMIQYNYLDEHTQAGRRGLMYAHEKGLPVFVMEPLRGGKLVNGLPQEAQKRFASHSVQHTPAEWGLRWLYNQSEITCVLSGMGSVDMVLQNAQTASSARPGELTEQDEAMLADVVAAINGHMKVGCTGCGYCMPCPKGVDIPGSFAAYNRRYTDGKLSALREYMMCTALRRDSSAASRCVGCGKCEMHCPQGIAIRKQLKNAAAALEGPAYKVARKAIEILRLY